MNEWILIKKQLPEAEKAVLCYCNHRNIFQEHIVWKSINIGKKNSWDNKFILENDDTTFVDVTHWMPLPEIPEKLNFL